MTKIRKYGTRSRSERRMEAEQRNEDWKLLSNINYITLDEMWKRLNR